MHFILMKSNMVTLLEIMSRSLFPASLWIKHIIIKGMFHTLMYWPGASRGRVPAEPEDLPV